MRSPALSSGDGRRTGGSWGASGKNPAAFACAAINCSTLARSEGSPAQALPRNIWRPGASVMAMASRKIERNECSLSFIGQLLTMRKIRPKTDNGAKLFHIFARQFVIEPRARESPTTLGRTRRNIHRAPRFLITKPHEKPKLDQFRGLFVLQRKLFQSIMNREKRLVIGISRHVNGIQIEGRCSRAAFQRLLASGAIDQDAPHGLSRRGEKVAPILPGLLL